MKKKVLLVAIVVVIGCLLAYFFVANKPYKHSHLLPKSVKEAIKGTPCESANTYEEYNDCVIKYNAQVLKDNKEEK